MKQKESPRKEDMMTQAPLISSHQAGGAMLAPIMTLAIWRLRQTWRLLLVTGLGVLMAVVLVCAAPLYAQVALTAGIRGVLTATPQDRELNAHASARQLTTASVARETHEIAQLMQQYLGTYLTTASTFFIQVPPLHASGLDPSSGIELTGTSMPQAASHVTLVQGRLPKQDSAELELALTPGTATTLGLKVGATLTIFFQFPTLAGPLTEDLAFQVVGLFRPNLGDPFWHGNSFGPVPVSEFTEYQALMSSDAFVATLDRLAVKDQQPGGLDFTDMPSLDWYYQLNPTQIKSTQLDDLTARLATAQGHLDDLRMTTEAPYLSALLLLGPTVEAFNAPSTLDHFRDRIAVAQIPITILTLQILGLVLFFISLMADLLVERQAEAIALLRSRGASRRQVFGSLIVQSIGLGALALVFGPLLAIVMARILAQGILPAASQGAVNVLSGDPLPVALGVGWYALATATCASLTVIVAIRGATRHTVLDLRREAGRDQRRPLWQRWYLDVVAMLLALVGYGISLYVTQVGGSDARVNLLISTPLALAAPLFLVLASLLFFLRFLPTLVNRLAGFARRRPEAAPMLALAQMARTPHHALRLVLLLGLASSFAIFSLVFTASEPPQLANVAAYQVGADFSGSFSPVTVHPPALAEQTAAYRSLPGVTSATLGYATEVNIQGTLIAVRAVDSHTFAHTTLWTDQDSSQSLTSLMAQLTSEKALASGKVPVIVDELAWEQLHLAIGAQVLLPVGQGATVPLIVVAHIQHLPTVNDSLVSGGTSDYTPPSGMLLDYQTLAGRAESLGQSLSANYVWLRTSDDPTLLAGIRAALNSGPLQLENLQDRRAILADFLADPLFLTIIGILVLGAFATLFLALAGTLLASWLNAHKRLTNFAVLRALGMEPRQIASVLIWELGIIYATALLLGLLFGGILVISTLPSLAFTGAPTYGRTLSSGEFYVLQHVLPMQTVIPLSLVLVLVALVALGGMALWMMAWAVSRPALAQTMRLNED
jgi:ABC-type lipoprotein release transport system permease subunit